MALEYVVTVRDNIMQWCPTCDQKRPVYATLEDGTKTWCCCFCSRIHRVEHVKETSNAQA